MVGASARDDATQKLVDEARAEAERRYFIPDSLRRTQIERFVDGARFGFEAAQRPPVSPEVREEVRAVVGEQLTKAGLNLDGPPYSDDGETQWPVALELRDRLTDALLARFSVPSRPPVSPEAVSALKKEVWTEYRDRVLIPLDPDRDEWPSRYEVFYAALDALLARFSVPSQPVYDEKRVSDIIRDGMIYERLGGPGGENGYERSVRTAAALVAALQGGELTREETNE